MKIEFSGIRDVHAPRDHVWEQLLDPEAIGKAGPGVENVSVVDQTHFRVTTGFGVAFLRFRFGLDVELHDLKELESLKILAQGKAPGGSKLDARAIVTLEDRSGGKTRIHWKAMPEFHGVVASVGLRLLEGIARSMTEEFWRDFGRDTERSWQRML